MFERTVSFWKRLVGSQPQTDTEHPEERRVSIRYPADLLINYQKAGGSHEFYRGRVRNISQGGINLVVDRECREGDLLGIELPEPDGQGTYIHLACVLHVRSAGSGEWSLGCTFTRELAPNQLAPFGGTATAAGNPELRNRPRFNCDIEACYQIVTADNLQAYSAKVLNLSATGIGLLVDRDVPPGTLLSVDLTRSQTQQARTILACVVHVAHQEKEWALGCNFITELTEQDLGTLL